MMAEDHIGRARDDDTTLLDTSSDAESIYYTLPSTPVESLARSPSGGRFRNQYGQYPGGISQWHTNMGFSQVPRADDQADEAYEEEASIPNEGLVISQKSNEITADSDHDDSIFYDTHSQFPVSWNETIDPVACHFGAQFNSRDSQTRHEVVESDPIAHSTYAANSVERNETSQYLPHQHLPLFDTVHHLPQNNYERPCIALSDPLGRTIRPVADDLYCLMLGDDSMSTNRLVKQVREMLHGLHSEWMGRLESTPELYIRCKPLSACRLLETGIRALEQCFSGNLPTSFEDLFALMHVAFAFSIVINRDRDSFYWDGFYSDLHYWHHTVRDSEISLFGKVWDRLWCPQSSNNHLFMNPPRGDLYETLMEGLVIKGCANFLDVVGHTTMAERQSRSAPLSAETDLPVIGSLKTKVIQPLTQRHAIKEYWEQIEDARSKLRSGLIRDVHEFELVLISRNKISNTSSHVHSRYMKEVASQFDLAMGGSGWRNGYHTTHLNLFLGLARESLVYDASKVHHCSPGLGTDFSDGTYATTSSSLLSLSSPNHFVHHNRPTMFPSPANPIYTAPTDNSRPTFSSYAPPLDGSFNPTTSSATSIELLSTSSAPVTPTTSRARSESASNVTLCDLCPGLKYTGKPESQRRSFRRHIQEKHSDTPRLTCSRCDATFGRSENLNRHVEQQHRQ